MWGQLVPTGTVVNHETIRTFDLVSTPVLDDRAVQELAQAMLEAAQSASEALGGVTRRMSTLELADTLDPIGRSAVVDQSGARFMVLDPLDGDSVLGLLHLTEGDATALADLFLGGPGRGAERRLTRIESMAITQLVGEIVAPIAAAATHRSLGAVRITETNDPEGLEEHLVRVGITVQVGSESIPGSLYVADPDKAGVSGGAEARKLVTSNVATMPIQLDIDLAAVNMPAADIHTLATGDVILFDVPTNAVATARHGRHRLLDGRVTDAEGRRFLEVTQVHTA